MTESVTARLFRDEGGYAHAEVPEPWHFLASYLRGDVQGDLDDTRMLRRLVEAYRSGQATEEWDGTGNAWTLIFTPGSEEALLELAVETGRDIWGTVPLEILDRLLAGWERMLVTGDTQLVEFDAYDPGPNTGP
jgi:hypothetical protein